MATLYSIKYNADESNAVDGFLYSTPENRWIWLKDAKRITLQKGQLEADKFASIVEGADIRLGKYRVQIKKKLATASPNIDTASNINNKVIDVIASSTSASKGASAAERALPCETTVTDVHRPEIDGDIMRVLRPHQLHAAQLLLRRLLGESIVAGSSSHARSDSHNQSSPRLPTDGPSALPSSTASSTLPVTGAILADEMGLGKTLTALTVLWALVRRGRSKAVIVCPSGLVANWKAEVARWIPTLSRKAIYVQPSKRNAQVHAFASSSPDLQPLLVVSYELFRSSADVLNRIASWEVLVCDEGHRLKNAAHTQTSLALSTCAAMRRLVLTGTPIQNNLEELYSLVSFACPGYLGSMEAFHAKFVRPLSRAKAAFGQEEAGDAVAQAHQHLQSLLADIMIRRTRGDVLSAILPPRYDYIVYCGLTPQQRVEYLQMCDSARGAKVTADEEECPSDGDTQQPAGSRKRRMFTLSALPTLTSLRLLSLSAFPGASAGVPPAIAMDESYNQVGAIESARPDTIPTVFDAAKGLFARSVKLKILDTLLTALYGTKAKDSVREKVVIVSNFGDCLDEVQVLAHCRHWPSLRIDGHTSADRRTRNVSHFNNPQSPFFLLLLGARSGGVGLNLIGGSRLILMDPDWNPATDAQAMGRIWRDGQTRPVHIYRLISAGTVEETILRRQSEKGALGSLLDMEAGNPCSGTATDLNVDSSGDGAEEAGQNGEMCHEDCHTSDDESDFSGISNERKRNREGKPVSSDKRATTTMPPSRLTHEDLMAMAFPLGRHYIDAPLAESTRVTSAPSQSPPGSDRYLCLLQGHADVLRVEQA